MPSRTTFIALLVTFCSMLSAQQVLERSDTMHYPGSDTVRVRNTVHGRLYNEYYFANNEEFRYREYLYSDTTYGYFQFEITGRVTYESVYYEFTLKDTLVMIAEYYKQKFNGRVQTFYNNGMLKTDSYYKMDKMEGMQYEYYDNGQISLKCNYANDKAEGIMYQWYPNGSLMEVGKCINNKYEDTVRYYHDNGQLKMVLTWKHDQPWEVVAMFDAEGNAQEKGTLKDGTGTIRYYDQFGLEEYYEVYRNGKFIESYDVYWEFDDN